MVDRGYFGGQDQDWLLTRLDQWLAAELWAARDEALDTGIMGYPHLTM